MLYLLIGFVLLLVAWKIQQNDKKDAIAWASFLALAFIGGTLCYQDLYYNVIVRNNIDSFYNGGYGITYENFDTNQTFVYYAAYSNETGTYFSYVQSEAQSMGLLFQAMPLLVLILVVYIPYQIYRKNLEGAKNGGKKGTV